MNEINIKEIRSNLGVSQEQLAKMIGVSPRTIQNWESGSKIPNSKHAILRKIEDESSIMEETQLFYGGEDTEPKGKLIPFYDDVDSIGGNNEMSANMDGVSRPTEYIDAGDWFRDATAAIRHYGESMVEYPPGCILALKEVYDRELIIPGRDYVIETSEYRVTKRIQLGKDTKHVTAYSTNPETYADGRLIHEPFDIPWRAIRHISLVLGYVVKKNGGTMVYSNKKQ